jgi:SSS family solute:Na+ symporter
MGSGSALSTLDLVTVLVYGLAILIHGFWVGRKNAGVDDYFLAGRNLTFGLIGFSLYASNMSGSSFVGLMGASYSHGFAVYHYEWTAAAVLIFFAFFMLPAFLRGRISTLPEFLERRFDVRCRRAFAAFTIFAILFIDMAGALYAGGLVLTSVFPGMSLPAAVLVLAGVAGLYTVTGGLSAVVITDAVQAVLLMLGAVLILVFGLAELGGLDAMWEVLQPRQTVLLRPLDDEFLPWPGILAVGLLGFYYWTLNQFVVQRTLAAQTLAEGQRGAFLAGLLKIPNLFLMVLPGVMATVLYPGLSNPDLVFPKLAFELLPVGLRGLVLTAVVAAIMSSLDSALNASASLVTYDFVKPMRPGISDRQLLRIGRVVTAMFMAVAVVYAPSIRSFENLFGYFQSILAWVTPPVVATYLAGLFTRTVTARAAFRTLVGGFAAGAAAFLGFEVVRLAEVVGLETPHYSYGALAMFMGAFTALVFQSRSGELRVEQTDTTTVRRSDWAYPLVRPVHRDLRVQAGGVALALAASFLLL